MSWKLILFDFDGVLCDSRALAIEYVEELRKDEAFGCLPSVRTVGHFGELYRGELRHALLRFGVSVEDSRRFFSSHAGAMKERTADLALYDGVAAGLNQLPAGRFAIITSAYSDAVRAILTRAGVDASGIGIIGHEVRKTKTEKATDLLTACGLSPSDAIYVGDMESDIEYCNGLGLRCAAVTYGYHPKDVLAQASPFELIDSPNELFAFLMKGMVAT